MSMKGPTILQKGKEGKELEIDDDRERKEKSEFNNTPGNFMLF